MDVAQVLMFDVGWIFFAAWGMVLAAVSVIAFGHDLLAFAERESGEANREKDRPWGDR
ncbi:MAG: hypothetical protein WAM69_08335 [Candidatus Sulfotelmatobacter sp.]